MNDQFKQFNTTAIFAFAAITITALRIATLIFSPVELGPDETQYWFWSRQPNIGYFSKPPMIAWLIAATTSVFGNAEWAVRLAAPFLHLGTAVFIFMSAKLIANDRAGMWAGLGWLTFPGVALSSFVIATDAPLLFFWSGALYLFLRGLSSQQSTLSSQILFGIAIGAGLLSKYAMIYFPLAMGIIAITMPAYRAKILSRNTIVPAITALVIFAPNIAWNFMHEFQTLSHTAANANWQSQFFNVNSLVSFLGGQAAMVGPVTFGFLIALILTKRNREIVLDDHRLRVLLMITLTPLIIILLQSFVSRAHANWAATAYPSLIILMAVFATTIKWRKINAANFVINAAGAVIFSMIIVNFHWVKTVDAHAVSVVSGWRAQTEIIAATAKPGETIAIDDRALMGAMLYYQRHRNFRLVALNPNIRIDHHYEAFMAFDPAHDDALLFVTTRDDPAHVDYRFTDIAFVNAIPSQTAGNRRRYHLYRVSGYFTPQ